MKKAILAAEDDRFFQHGPVSLRSIIRAAFGDIINARVVQGGSTLTQQLLKNLYLTSKKNTVPKVKRSGFILQNFKISNKKTVL